MGIKLGFTTGCLFMYDLSLFAKAQEIAKIQTDAIEVGYKLEWLNDSFNEHFFKLLNTFKHVSIHAPTQIRYPFVDGIDIVEKLTTIVKLANANCIVFHPDLIDDFDWLNTHFGDLVAFENMDVTRPFGNTVANMEAVYAKSPQAKFVFDLNHIYSIDRSMKLAMPFFETFGTRLSHYHVSALTDKHTAFSKHGDEIVLSGLFDLTKPIIHEGPDPNLLDFIQDEYDYTLRNIHANAPQLSPLTQAEL